MIRNNGYKFLLRKRIDGLKDKCKKPIHLCVSINSTSAASFWKNYFIKSNVENIRGHIYSIVH